MSVETHPQAMGKQAAGALVETQDQLKKNALNTWDVISQSLAFLGPVMSMAFLTGYVAIAAGAATPLAVFLGGLTMVALGYVVAQFASRVHAAGAIYNYATKAFGPEVGFMGGWIYLFATLCLTVAIIAGVAGWITQFLLMVNILTEPVPFLWVGLVALECVALFLLSHFDIRISTRTQLWLVFASLALVLLLALYVIIRGGAEGQSGIPFSLDAAGGIQGLTYGMIFAILMYTGFESSAVLAEETRDPKRSMPIAIVGTVAAAVLVYTIVTYAYSIGFGVNDTKDWADPTKPALFSIAGIYGGDALVSLVFLAAIIDGFAVMMGCLTTSARVAYAMARDGALPKSLSRTHAVYHTPFVANISILVLAMLVAAVFALVMPTGAVAGSDSEFGYLAGIGAIAIEVIYTFVSLAAIVWFRRQLKSEYSVVKHLVIPLVAILGAGAALYGSLQPAPDALLQSMPYVALAWIVLGLLYIAVLRSTRPGLVAQIGRDLSTLDVPEQPDARLQYDVNAGSE